jgi:hypothetical protein
MMNDGGKAFILASFILVWTSRTGGAEA